MSSDGSSHTLGFSSNFHGSLGSGSAWLSSRSKCKRFLLVSLSKRLEPSSAGFSSDGIHRKLHEKSNANM